MASKRVSNKRHTRVTPPRSRVRYGRRRQTLREASFKYLGHPNGTTTEVREAIEAELKQ